MYAPRVPAPLLGGKKIGGKESNMIRLRIFMGLLRVWTFITQGKCKYYDVCDLSRPDNQTCTKDRGQFYGFGRYGGCYRRLEESRAINNRGKG